MTKGGGFVRTMQIHLRQLRGWLMRLFGLLRRNQREREFAVELESHLALHIADNLRAGMSPEEARRQALIKLGGVTQTQELHREQGGLPMIETLLQDLRFGLRMLRKNLGFSLVAILTLALGIGANTAIFSLARALLLRPLSVPQPEQLITMQRGEEVAAALSWPDFTALRERNEVFTGLAVHDLNLFHFSYGARSEVLVGELVSANYFDVLGVQPLLGRGFAPEEDRTPDAHPVVVLSHALWQTRLGGATQIIGQTIVLNNNRFTVVGVAPAGFPGTAALMVTQLWIPATMLGKARPEFPADLNDRSQETFTGIGRLKPGVGLAQAQAALAVLGRQLDLANPVPVERGFDPQADRTLRLNRVQGLSPPHLRRMARLATTLLFAVVGIVLLIACANVANLLLARAATRRKEIAVRLALGASRLRLVRQLLTESLLLALLGAAAGLLLAWWINRLLMAFKPPLPAAWGFQVELLLDAPVLGFTLLLSLLVSVFFGLAPAWQASRPDVIPALKDEAGVSGRRHQFNLRNALVVAQLAVSLMLLIGAGLFVRSLQHLQTIDPGFETANRLTVSFDLAKQGYDETRRREFARQLLERVAALPGVRNATVADTVPLGFAALAQPVVIEGRAAPPNEPPPWLAAQTIGLNYFSTLGIQLVRGRAFDARDTATAPPVALINERLAQRFFPNEDALGKRLRIGADNAPWREIVGIVKDTTVRNLGEGPRSVTYRPLTQQSTPWLALVAQTGGEPKALIADVRRVVQTLDENLPAQEIKTLAEVVAFAYWPARMSAGLLGVFGLLGLLLAAVGLYGLMSYAVAQRTREIGIRMALGAAPRDVLRLIVKQGLWLALVGAGAGLLLAFALTRLLTSLLYGVRATDLATFGVAALVLVLVALLACWIAARRATKVDPMIALRME